MGFFINQHQKYFCDKIFSNLLMRINITLGQTGTNTTRPLEACTNLEWYGTAVDSCSRLLAGFCIFLRSTLISGLTDLFLIICFLQRRKEGNVLFNDALNTFYLQLYGVGHMVKDHSDSERGNPMLPHGLLFLISSKIFYMHHPTDRIAHTTAFVLQWLEWETAQWVHPMKDRSDDPSHHERTLLPRSYISLLLPTRKTFSD